MINVLHISAVKTWGGGENHIQNLCLELQKNPQESSHHILCVKNSEFEEKLSHLSIPFSTAPLKIKMDLRYAFQIIRLVKKLKIDIIHIHDPSALALVVIADKFYNLPAMVFSKKTSFPIKNRKSTLYKYNYKKIKKYLCVSKETERITKEAIIDHTKVITVYHGTSVPKIPSKSVVNLREKHSIDKNYTLVGVIGNHIRAKHLETLIEVIHQLVNIEKQQYFRFIQIGSFTDRTPDLLAKIEEYNIGKYINFTNHLHEASDYIPQFDIFMMTSQSEGIPQSIYESFYYKVPVISTNVGGIPEIIDNRINGLLADKYDALSLVKHLIDLTNNKELQKQFVDKSYIRLLNEFTTEKMAINTLEVYKEIAL